MALQHIRATDDHLLQNVADTLAASRKILMITGAGISTSCGIPVRVSYAPAASFAYKELGLSLEGRSLRHDPTPTATRARRFIG